MSTEHTIQVDIDHNSTTKSLSFDCSRIECGDYHLLKITINNKSQYTYEFEGIDFGDVKHMSLVKAFSNIPGNKSGTITLKVEPPLDLREPIKGNYQIKGWHLIE